MVYFLSDAHIGSRAFANRQAHEKKIADLLMQMQQDATEIFLLGDMLDFWYEFFWQQKEQFTLFFDTLKKITQKGITVHYFIGNHDLWTFGWLQKRTGVIVHKTAEQMQINGKLCYLAHGDGVMPTNYLGLFSPEKQRKIKQFIILRRIFHNPFMQKLFRLFPPKIGNAIGYTWAKKSRQKELAKPTNFMGEQKESLILFAKEQEKLQQHHDYYIFGHRHIDIDFQITSVSRVIILGDLFRLNTYAQMDDNGNITLKNI